VSNAFPDLGLVVQLKKKAQRKRLPKMRRRLELGGPVPLHHCRGAWKQQDEVTKSTWWQRKSRKTRSMWWLRLKLVFSIKKKLMLLITLHLQKQCLFFRLKAKKGLTTSLPSS